MEGRALTLVRIDFKIFSTLAVIIVILTVTPVVLEQGKQLTNEVEAPSDIQYGKGRVDLADESENMEQVKAGSLEESGMDVSEPKLACKYFVESDFKRSVLGAVLQKSADDRLLGGIVTHHLLADSLIAPFFSALSTSKPELVFIIGPNHKRLGQEKINTGSWDWQTPFGVLEADGEAVKSIAENCKAGENFDLLETEHSISSLVPYVKYFLPEARIVPILLHGNYGMKASVELAGKIRKAAGSKKWIVIGSIDFSHYLTPEAAGKMDEITLKAIEAGNLEALSQMGNDNLDSPPSLITLLSVMKDEGDYEMMVTGHSNSSEIAGKYSDSTTSYFTMLFYRK